MSVACPKITIKFVSMLQKLTYEQRVKVRKLPSLEKLRKGAEDETLSKLINLIQEDKFSSHIAFFQYAFFCSDDIMLRGHRFKLFRNRCRSKTRSDFFSRRVADVWNSLPDEVATGTSVNSLNKVINTMVIGSPDDHIYCVRSAFTHLWLW